MLKLTNPLLQLVVLALAVLGQTLLQYSKDYVHLMDVLPALIAFIGFVFTVRTFLLFKIKDSLLADSEDQKLFDELQEKGFIPSHETFFGKLNRLDQCFHEVQISLCGLIVLIATAKVVNNLYSCVWIARITNAFAVVAVVDVLILTIGSSMILKQIIQVKPKP